MLKTNVVKLGMVNKVINIMSVCYFTNCHCCHLAVCTLPKVPEFSQHFSTPLQIARMSAIVRLFGWRCVVKALATKSGRMRS